MKNIGWIIGGLLVLSNSKKGTAPSGSQLGNYATPPITRPASPAGRSQSSSGGPSASSTGGGGARPGTQSTGQNFWSSLENLFTGNKIDTSTSPDPSVPDFWATPTNPSGVSDIIGSIVDQSSGIPQFGGDPSLQFDENGLIIDPTTGLPFGQASSDIPAPGIAPEPFGPEPPPDPADGTFDDGGTAFF